MSLEQAEIGRTQEHFRRRAELLDEKRELLSKELHDIDAHEWQTLRQNYETGAA